MKEIMELYEHLKAGSTSTLCRLSLVSTAVHLWELEETKTQIRNYFSKTTKFIDDIKNWHSITKHVLEYLPLFPVQPPATVLSNLQDIIISTGEKIYRWYQFVGKCLKLDTSYAETIYWTPSGTIDEEKIFQLYWRNDTSLFIGTEGPEDIPIYRIACILTEDEFIFQHRKGMIEEMKRFDPDVMNFPLQAHQNPDDVVGIILPYFITMNYIEEAMFDKFGNGISSEDVDLLCLCEELGQFVPQIKMYQLCLAVGFNRAARFFFRNLSDSEKKLICASSVRSLIKKFFNVNDSDFRKERYGEIYLDLIKDNTIKMHMENDKEKFEQLFKISIIYDMILLNYPVQEFFIAIHENISSQFKEDDLRQLLLRISRKIGFDYKKNCPIKRNLYRDLLFITWRKASKNLKASLSTEKDFIKIYFEMSDFESLKVLLNSKNFRSDDLEFYVLDLWTIYLKSYVDRIVYYYTRDDSDKIAR